MRAPSNRTHHLNVLFTHCLDQNAPGIRQDIIKVLENWFIKSHLALVPLQPVFDLTELFTDRKLVLTEPHSVIGFFELLVEVGHRLVIQLLDVLVKDYPQIRVSLEYQFEEILTRPIDDVWIFGRLVSSVSASWTTLVATHGDGLRPEDILWRLFSHGFIMYRASNRNGLLKIVKLWGIHIRYRIIILAVMLSMKSWSVSFPLFPNIYSLVLARFYSDSAYRINLSYFCY